VHVTLVTAASSGTHTRAMGWQAARPCAYTGAPDDGLWIPERGLGDTDGVSVTIYLYLVDRRRYVYVFSVWLDIDIDRYR